MAASTRAGEYDIAPCSEAHPDLRFLELGRSCVLKPYRNKRTVELLWHGIWTYVLHHRIDVMIGCASLEGTRPAATGAAPELPASLRGRARPSGRRVPCRIASRRWIFSLRTRSIPKAALHALPPMIKGYLRLGATFGTGAVIDRQFGTTDVLVVLPVSAINPRYIDHFGPAANRHAA